MAYLKDILAYLIIHSPVKSALSNARLTKLVYLADWRHAIQRSKQISDIQWVFDNYGPFVWDVKEAAQDNRQLFSIISTENIMGGNKTIIGLQDMSYEPVLTRSEKESLLHTIRKTSHLNWDAFIRLIYSTYPIINSERYARLDLVRLAREYQPTIPAA